MTQTISKAEFTLAERKMNELLEVATSKGGFNFLTEKERSELNMFTETVRLYEEMNYSISAL